MIFWTIVLGLLFIAWLYKLNKDYVIMACFARRVRTVDGTPLEKSVYLVKGRTIFANSFDFLYSGTDNVFQFARDRALKIKRSYLQYGFTAAIYNIITAEDAELVMLDQKNLITKGIVYRFMEPFLNKGLLTSTGKHWHSRRKMLTPAFHFNILGHFEEIFKEESNKFVNNLEKLDLSSVTLNEIIPKFTLNTVCETALGIKLDEQSNADQYRESFKMIEGVFVGRIGNPFYMFDTTYKLFLEPKIKKHITMVHKFSSDIVNRRRKALEAEIKNKPKEDDEELMFNTKKRYAMLDTLLNAERDGLIDHAGICEEVDTFMFEGYDTTSMTLLFSLMKLSLYPKIQERCYQEILDNIDDDLSTLDVNQINKLKYLECFTKEVLRHYPSVPMITREVTHETKLSNNLILPKGAQITIHIFDIHRNPKYWPNPNEFDPERFTPENSAGRHPFAYVPFSAGQRNCIGQKFAMLEVKTFLVYILKTYKILPKMAADDKDLRAGLVIRTPSLIKVQFEKRV